MKMSKSEEGKNVNPLRATLFVIGIISFVVAMPSHAQKKQMVQIKTFDQSLAPFKNLDVSINGKGYITIGNKGSAFAELLDDDFPIKSITVKDEKMEAASWNYSKGILEIIIRNKSYHLSAVIVQDQKNKPLPNVNVTYQGRKTISLTTNSSGALEIPLALDEKINSLNQFSVPDFKVVKLDMVDGKHILTLQVANAKNANEEAKQQKKVSYFNDFDLSKLDSIQSLTVFYAIFKNYQIKDMSEEARQKIDAKFNQLVAQLQNSGKPSDLKFMGKISDSSYVSDDIKNLLSRAEEENQTLELQRSEFDQKIQIIQEKLASGISNLDETTRMNVLSDLTRLESLLIQNEGKFYKNQNDYKSLINSLKEKYFDVTDLENKLFVSEAQRLEEQKAFRQKLFITLGVLFFFTILSLMLVYFSDKLRKQKKELVRVNGEINRINENLESLVAERTRLLEEANKELDTFLYRASHDLRSPVCSIIGLCNIALHLSNGESKELVERVVLTTSSMDKLLKKLSIISEINQPTNFSSITLLDLLENVRANFGKVIDEHKVTFTVNCPADLVMFSYPNLVETILANLVENALFYAVMKDPKNATVALSASIKDNGVEISVYDNGIGVEETINSRLFDMFFKGHVNSKGNGLGLYIVQKSVQALNGKIEVESEVGNYAKFIVWLPLHLMTFGDTLGAPVDDQQKFDTFEMIQ
ncbi:ATP-binding protein [Chryseolinea sp. H1M3-3]|uniref:sensor histidine kinase n=1 Tax=Chryseolinea sp. H1M3-3 TaxID=3034144 RepID=UPI0023EC5B6D|nr:ATP-binding protein [Chryseolinea sp. H1M3-3]